jgi:hypothetical protein
MTAHTSPEGFSGALSFLGDRCPVQMRKDTPRAFYASCAKAGLTVAQTARLGMVTHQAVKDFAARHGLMFVGGAEATNYDADVARLHGEGLMCKEAASRLGVHISRVRRISDRLKLRWRGPRGAEERPPVTEKRAVKKTGLRTRMAEAKAQLTKTELEDFEWLMSKKGYRFVPALRVLGRHDLAERLEAKA